ncbi:ATP-binding cassette domain-containing protein [Peribacillus simplex]|uniref:ATP-binding cassette domain-containing protein n=1 Tax=Peribacillus simplex TaxID=1478 RepID=UPI0011A8E8D0|nr:ABC transporter ATP-binding protein [Peribacillus simplex]
MTKIQISSLNKQMKKKTLLHDINYEFSGGKIYGLYGRNGSGKTMLLRAIAGLIMPSSGEISIDEKILHKEISYPANISVIIENTSLLHQYDAYTNLKILAKIRNIATDEDIKMAIKRVGLDPDSKMKTGKFSLGMKQRLSVAQAIFEKPDILLLDEPTNAIDEEGVIQVYQILKEEKERGALIILTSHHKQDLEMLADEYINMDNGGIVLDSK